MSCIRNHQHWWPMTVHTFWFKVSWLFLVKGHHMRGLFCQFAKYLNRTTYELGSSSSDFSLGVIFSCSILWRSHHDKMRFKTGSINSLQIQGYINFESDRPEQAAYNRFCLKNVAAEYKYQQENRPIWGCYNQGISVNDWI